MIMRKLSFALTALTALIGFSSIGHSGTITYAIQNYPDDQGGYNVSGSITTDGTIGNLTASNVLFWTWTITSPNGSVETHSSNEPFAFLQSQGVVASSSEITIGTDPAIPGGYSNGFEMSYFPPVGASGSFTLAYVREGDDSSSFNHYFGGNYISPDWLSSNPSMGGTDPWVIASAVPEPSSIALMGFAAAFGLVLRSTRKQELRLK